MEIARKEKRPLGIYIAAVLKSAGALMFIAVLVAMFLPYLKDFLIKEDYKFISDYLAAADKILSNPVLQVYKNSFAALLFFAAMQLLISAEGLISRRWWVWLTEVLIACGISVLFILIIFWNIIDIEGTMNNIPRWLNIFTITVLVGSLLYLFYLLKKSIRDYFGIFKRRLK